MKKKKIVKKYNELANKYNELLEEIETMLEIKDNTDLLLEQEREEKEALANAFAATKEQYSDLIRQVKEIKHERDVYRKNYGELVSIAVTASENDGAISIKGIEFGEDVTTITWSDNEKTSVRRQKGEKHDVHTAVAYAIAKRVLGTTSIGDVVEYYQEDHSKDEKYLKTYRSLKSKNPMYRIKAQKYWEKIPKGKRQQIKAMARKLGK